MFGNDNDPFNHSGSSTSSHSDGSFSHSTTTGGITSSHNSDGSVTHSTTTGW